MTRRIFLTMAAAFITAAISLPALADEPYREFTGRIDVVNKKKFIVDNRQGDKVSFVFIKDTEVSGEKKLARKIKKGDWCSQSSRFVAKTRSASMSVVFQPRDEDD